VARALIVGCGCRGRALGSALLEWGWVARGTTRNPEGAALMDSHGIEGVVADPDGVATVLDWIGDVTVIFWLLGSAVGERDAVAALNGSRLERLMEELVDSPVRGFVYEAAGTGDAADLARGSAIVTTAAERWRIPVETVAVAPGEHAEWLDAMLAAARRLTGAAPPKE
jgi:hypothetical protein